MTTQIDARTLYAHFYRAARCHMPTEILNVSTARNYAIYRAATTSWMNEPDQMVGWRKASQYYNFVRRSVFFQSRRRAARHAKN